MYIKPIFPISLSLVKIIIFTRETKFKSELGIFFAWREMCESGLWKKEGSEGKVSDLFALRNFNIPYEYDNDKAYKPLA
jgi:hypothetical protein